MKTLLQFAALAIILSSCAEFPPEVGSAPSWDNGVQIETPDLKKTAPRLSLGAQEKAAFRNTERANALFNEDITIYADKVEFLDAVHKDCIATGHVWIKCAKEVSSMKLREMFGENAEINFFEKTFVLRGKPRAYTATSEIAATTDTGYFELRTADDGIQLKMFGPNRVDPLDAE
jgi:hypothetical protein